MLAKAALVFRSALWEVAEARHRAIAKVAGPARGGKSANKFEEEERKIEQRQHRVKNQRGEKQRRSSADVLCFVGTKQSFALQQETKRGGQRNEQQRDLALARKARADKSQRVFAQHQRRATGDEHVHTEQSRRQRENARSWSF